MAARRMVVRRTVARRLARDVEGLSTVEYVLIFVIVALAGILVWQSFGSSVSTRVDEAITRVEGMDGQGRAAPAGSGAAEATAAVEGREDRAASGTGQAANGSASAAGAAGARSGTSSAAGGVGATGGAGGEEGEAGDESTRATRAAELPVMDDGPNLFVWIGWLIVAILAAVTVFSALGKRVGKG